MTGVPEWLAPGAKVLVYTANTTVASTRHLKITTVKKLAGKSFTVDDEYEPRFKLADQSGRIQHGGFSSTIRMVVPFESDEARLQLEGLRLYRLQARARNAVETWMRSRNRWNRMAAIEALEAVEVDEVDE